MGRLNRIQALRDERTTPVPPAADQLELGEIMVVVGDAVPTATPTRGDVYVGINDPTTPNQVKPQLIFDADSPPGGGNGDLVSDPDTAGENNVVMGGGSETYAMRFQGVTSGGSILTVFADDAAADIVTISAGSTLDLAGTGPAVVMAGDGTNEFRIEEAVIDGGTFP